MKANGERVITLQVELAVKIDDVEYSNIDEYSDLLHNRVMRDRVSRDLSSHVRSALRQLSIAYPRVVVDVDASRAHFQILTDEKNTKITDEMSKDSHAKWQAEYDKVCELVDALVAKELPSDEIPAAFIYSYDNEALLENRPFAKGVCRFIYTDGWGDDQPILSRLFTDPTYQDVALAGALLVHASNDSHHIFLEAASFVEVDKDGVSVYRMVYGS